MFNRLIIAAAGSGKTTYLIKNALEQETPVLITTYTEANAEAIKIKIIEEKGFIPNHIKVQTWFSFLIQHGVKPYQNFLFDFKVKGMLLMNERSGLKYRIKGGIPIYYSENDFFHYFFTATQKIYSDKLSNLVCKLDEASGGKVISRLAKIYSRVLVDECQDLAGYDLDILKLVAKSSSKLTLVGDPRQVTYLTHNERKYEKYKNGRISDFIDKECGDLKFEVDLTTLAHSYRCNQEICDYSNKLYPEMKACNSANHVETGHDGIYLVQKNHVPDYINEFSPVQLRWNSRTKVSNETEVYNFGASKGLTFARTLIYPTKDMFNWIKADDNKLKDAARAKFYVGLTRAKYSVGIVCNSLKEIDRKGLNVFKS